MFTQGGCPRVVQVSVQTTREIKVHPIPYLDMSRELEREEGWQRVDRAQGLGS